jgi:hypothetical protein
VVRRRHPEDRQAYLMHPTRKGRAVQVRAVAILGRQQDLLLRPLNQEETRVLSVDRHHDLRGKNTGGRPPRGRSSSPARPCSNNRLRHLETILRRVSSRKAISSLSNPSAAMSTILARIISRYGNVYRRDPKYVSVVT